MMHEQQQVKQAAFSQIAYAHIHIYKRPISLQAFYTQHVLLL